MSNLSELRKKGHHKSKIYPISLIVLLILCSVNSSYGYQWEKTFGGTDSDWGRQVQLTRDGGFIIIGSTQSLDDEGNSVQQTADAGYIITGRTFSTIILGPPGSPTIPIGPAVYLIKTDANGNKLSEITFGGIDYDVGSSVQQTKDGGFIIAGSTESLGAGGQVFI